MKVLAAILLLMLTAVNSAAQKLVRYDLFVTDTLVEFTGKYRPAIAVNGQIPMPTLYFTEGDTAEIVVHNRMHHHETSIHWHGLLLPNEQDGVPYLTTAPIAAHSAHTYRFVLKQSGTYWYHSHTMLQEQVGMYGAIVIYRRNSTPEPEEVLLLSDWSDENPHQIERSLHSATDWYMIKKNAVQSYGEAFVQGYPKTKFINEFKRMHAMDVSDVFYDRFLVNGRQSLHFDQYKAGDTVRLRVINGSASTYFWLQYTGGKITVVASDGMDVIPVEVDRLIVGVSEIFDVKVVIHEAGKRHYFVATAEDRTGHAFVTLGNGRDTAPPLMKRLNYFEGMKMMNEMTYVSGRMHDMGMNMSLQKMDMNAAMYPEATDGSALVTLDYSMLESPEVTSLPDVPFREMHFELTGNMNRYVWTLNNKTISESDKVMIRAGENIRIILRNNSMMRHPMHLHGHFFRIINGKGQYAPLKNVIDIMPMETDTIEFHASETYGDWFFHCHILYHMMAGMGRIFTYQDSPPNLQITDPKRALKKVYADDRRFYLGAEVAMESNGTAGEASLMNTRWRLDAEWRIGFNDASGYETESHFGRYLGTNQFWFAYTGWDWRYQDEETSEENWFGQDNTSNKRGVFCFGLLYTMPWLIRADLRIDDSGFLRLQFSREDIPITKLLRLSGSYNSDMEYDLGARYILTKYISLSARFDSDLGLGAGVTFTY